MEKIKRGRVRRFVEQYLGYELDDSTRFPDGPPSDLVAAVEMLAQVWRENSSHEVPPGIRAILDIHRVGALGK